jgi:glucose-1-phosphate cytidylyltransferase
MKAVILAGGLGSRLSEETYLRPKPMVEIGGKPILWHLMKLYSAYDINEFIICCGYKGYLIKEYFANYFLHNSDVTFYMTENRMEVHQKSVEPWAVTLVDTGEDTQTGGRLRRVAEYIRDDEAFCFTYGDGLSDVNISKLVEFHHDHGKLVTITAVKPPARYGALEMEGKKVTRFKEKPASEGGLINGGFFVASPKSLKVIAGDQTSWENDALPILVEEGAVAAFEHQGFWQAMDTIRDKNSLQELWETGNAPWKNWSA